MSTPRVQFPKKLQFLFQPAPYKVPYGGRGSAKSWSIARALLILGAATTIRCLCTREYQKSIKESVHQILRDQIERLGLDWCYRVTDNMVLNTYTGTFFIFGGLHSNAHEIKSKEGLTHCWIEEAENVSKTSWEYLEPTIRTPWLLPTQFWPKDTQFTHQELEDGGRWVDPEIWISFNPADETDFIYQYFVGGEHPAPTFKPPPGAIVVPINWQDNPWFPDNLRRQKDHLYSTDPDGAEHIWGGKPRKQSAAQVLRGKYVVEHFEPESHWDGPYQGTDWGFATDPSVEVRCWIHDQVLYIEHEAYEFHTETDDIPKLLSQIPDSAKHVNRADSARPETISYCRRHGHPLVVGVEKWPGSVEDGILYLRQEFRQIVIHPRCVNTHTEARLWSYKVDKNTQEVLPQVEDKNNHCWDAIRYALAPLIRGKVKLKPSAWRRWTNRSSLETLVTLKIAVVTIEEVSEGAAEFGASYQLWGMRAAQGMYLIEEYAAFGEMTEILDFIATQWSEHSRAVLSIKPATELWLEAKAVGQTFLRTLRGRSIPAREWLGPSNGQSPEDAKVLDPDYRAKQASVHLSAGRVFAPEGPVSAITEIEGLATNAATLALLIWQQRGGGQGPVPE